MSRIEKTVFISYRRRDFYAAMAVFKNLTQNGYDAFIDYDGITAGDFEQAILDNIRARAHFVLLLTPTALERCSDETDWLRREIEVAIDARRNIVPMLLNGFTLGAPIAEQRLQGSLAPLRRYQAVEVPDAYFDSAMERLRERFLAVPVDAVLHPVSLHAQQVATQQQEAARAADLRDPEAEVSLGPQPSANLASPAIDVAARQGAPPSPEPLPNAPVVTGAGLSSSPGEPPKWRFLLSALGLAFAAVLLWVAFTSGNGEAESTLPLPPSPSFDKADGPAEAKEQSALGDDFYHGRNGQPKDYVQAVSWFRKAAEQGDVAGQINLGYMYQFGLGVVKDEAQAVSWYRKAAEQGNATAQFNLGVMYRKGNGVVKDDVQAVSWFRKAAEQGNATAQFNLGVMYRDGHGVVKDDAQAVDWFRKAAEQGNAIAQFNLGVRYQFGHGVVKDEAQAVSWYRKAAEQGKATAQLNLGFMYDKGLGVVKDDVQALDWYRKAAEQGNATAQFNLGVMYGNGYGVVKDDVQAASWYRKAAEQGKATAQAYLAAMVERGAGGLTKDRDRAVELYRAAAAQGNDYAKNALERLGET